MLSHLLTSSGPKRMATNERDKIVERMRKKEQEIQELESSIKDAKVYLQALQDVLRLFPRETEGGGADVSLRAGSLVAQAREIILKHGAPMHVNDIVKAMGRDLTRTNQTGVAGSIAAYVRKGEIFTRTGPNTFSLIELERAEPEEAPLADEPPPDFGQDPVPAEQPKSTEDFDDDIPF
jgi:hypothetical protein